MIQRVDYHPFLNQARIWPREVHDQIENFAINDMAHQHAISAYHKLLDWGLGSTRTNIIGSVLAQALLEQAVGEPVWLLSSVDIPAKAVEVLRKTYQVSMIPLELCFDALNYVDSLHAFAQVQPHPVKRAQELQTYFNDHLGEQ